MSSLESPPTHPNSTQWLNPCDVKPPALCWDLCLDAPWLLTKENPARQGTVSKTTHEGRPQAPSSNDKLPSSKECNPSALEAGAQTNYNKHNKNNQKRPHQANQPRLAGNMYSQYC